MFYVDTEKCNGCGACVAVCPQRVIDLIGANAVINHRVCKECGNCLEVCSAGAIYEEVKEPQFIRINRGAQASAQGKELCVMPFGIGRGGLGMGRGMGYGRGFGMGRGNPYPFCRFYPWLPRRWWAYGSGYTPAQPPPQTFSPGSNYSYPAPYPRW
jgi:ferredoxin